MPTLCVIGFDDYPVIKDFIRLHMEKLPGKKICLTHWFPSQGIRRALFATVTVNN